MGVLHVKTLGKPKNESQRIIKENAARPKLGTIVRKHVKFVSKMMGLEFRV